MTDNRTNEPTERAAVAMQAESSGFFSMEAWRHLARAALTAAGAAPVLPSSICQHNMVSYTDSVSEKPENFCSLCGYQPSSGVDVETLANLIHSTSVAHFGGLDPRVAPIIARAVAAWLKRQGGESRDAVDKD